MGSARAEQTAESCIIVVQVRGVQIGLQVDKVSEVVAVAAADVEAPPSFGEDVETDYLVGLAKTQGRGRLLLNIDRVLASSNIVRISEAAGLAA